jgi:hypothetical protein
MSDRVKLTREIIARTKPRFKMGSTLALAVGLALFAGKSGADDTIPLSCSGSFTDWRHPNVKTPIEPSSLIIDLEKKTATLNVGDFPITEATESEIRFEGAGWRGQIDLLSWSALVIRSDAKFRVEFSCKRASPKL